MANYYCTTRTNYFRVVNEDAFVEFMDHVLAFEDQINVWTMTDSDGNKLYGFGCYSGIMGYFENPDDHTDDEYDHAFEEFVEGLSEHIAEGDAAIIFEIGNEKLRYVSGYATIVTKYDVETIDLTVSAAKEAAKLLKNPDWKTRCEY